MALLWKPKESENLELGSPYSGMSMKFYTHIGDLFGWRRGEVVFGDRDVLWYGEAPHKSSQILLK